MCAFFDKISREWLKKNEYKITIVNLFLNANFKETKIQIVSNMFRQGFIWDMSMKKKLISEEKLISHFKSSHFVYILKSKVY